MLSCTALLYVKHLLFVNHMPPATIIKTTISSDTIPDPPHLPYAFYRNRVATWGVFLLNPFSRHDMTR